MESAYRGPLKYTMNNECVHRLVATSLPAMWHLESMLDRLVVGGFVRKDGGALTVLLKYMVTNDICRSLPVVVACFLCEKRREGGQ